MSIVAIFLKISNFLKPLLLRIFPVELLRTCKKNLIKSSMENLNQGRQLQFCRDDRPDGINLIGYIRGEIGLGQSCRLMASAIQESKLAFTIYNYEQVSAMRYSDTTWDEKITDAAPYNINLLHINPYEMPLAYVQLGSKVWKGRYNIAFWLWELEQFPPEWENSLKLVDEIWTPSEHASASIRKVTKKPVYIVPYPIEMFPARQNGREQFKLPQDKFLFLCMYDCNSTMERKNPMGVICAFKQAFPVTQASVGLVIKMNNPQKKDLDIIREALDGYPHVYIIADVLEKRQVNDLIECVDVFVSLHRAEGFGLVIAEAMCLGTPVIATNWSSNVEFMSPAVSCLVDYTFAEIEYDAGPYKKGCRWAEPNEAQAAEYMVRLYSDNEYYNTLKIGAGEYVRQVLKPEKAARLIQERIAAIYSESAQ